MFKQTKAQILQALDDREDGLPISADMKAALLEYDRRQMLCTGQEHERFLLNQKNDSFQAKFEQLAKKCNAEEIAIEERHRLFSELCKQFPVAG